MWVPQSTGSPNNSGNQPSDYWPGGRWVDWVGVDIYAKYPNFSGMERIYRSYHKPFVVGEWSPWDFDSPSFVHRLFNFAQSHNRVKMLVYYQGFDSRPAPDLALPSRPQRPAPRAQPRRRRSIRPAPSARSRPSRATSRAPRRPTAARSRRSA